MQERRDSGDEECRKGEIQEMRDVGKENSGDHGYRKG